MTNAFIDQSGKYYAAATASNMADMQVVNHRPELIAALLSDGAK